MVNGEITRHALCPPPCVGSRDVPLVQLTATKLVYRWKCGCISQPVPIKRNAKHIRWIAACRSHLARQDTEATLKWHPKEYGAIPQKAI